MSQIPPRPAPHYIQSMMNADTDDIEGFMRDLRLWAEGTEAWVKAVHEPVLRFREQEAALLRESGFPRPGKS